MDFDRSGRLVTTSYDGFVRIYAAEHYYKPDLAGIQAQILSETQRQDLHARPQTSGGCRPAPQTPEPPAEGQCRDAQSWGVSAAALSATALCEVARKCRLPNPQGELLTLARRYERRADYLLSKYAADDLG